jgi:hypothetical protein
MSIRRFPFWSFSRPRQSGAGVLGSLNFPNLEYREVTVTATEGRSTRHHFEYTFLVDDISRSISTNPLGVSE